MLPNYHVFKVRYYTSWNLIWLNSQHYSQTEMIPFADDEGNTRDQAIKWLTDNGYELVGMGEGNDHYYLMSTTFKPLK